MSSVIRLDGPSSVSGKLVIQMTELQEKLLLSCIMACIF